MKYLNRFLQETTENRCIIKVGEKSSYIKTNSRYGDALFNPYDEFYSPGEEFQMKDGESVYKFTKVNQKCLDYYMKFLSTQNVAFYKQAEREIYG